MLQPASERVSSLEWRASIGAYVRLTKPRVIELLLVTSVPPMLLAARGMPSARLLFAVLIGGALAAGGANTINCWVERDSDQLMHRTDSRPLPAGEIVPSHALVFGIVLNVVAFVYLALAANLLAASLTMTATLFYVFVYTIWLKPRTAQNIVIGGAAGAVPVLVGWAAVKGDLSAPAWILFAVVFFWTPAHFWALAFKYRDDYAAADVPMLPAVASFATTARRIIEYTVALWFVSVLFAAVGNMGLIYLAASIVLGGVFLLFAVQLRRDATPARAMRLFTYSISYVTLLFSAMALDQLVHVRA